VIGANLSVRVLMILGLANLIADGFAMAAGNFSGTKAERDDFERVLGIERRHIAAVPEGEREGGDDLDRVVKSRWSPAGWVRSGLETLGIGVGAAALAFTVGVGLRSF
jgi:hypothetical protein